MLSDNQLGLPHLPHLLKEVFAARAKGEQLEIGLRLHQGSGHGPYSLCLIGQLATLAASQHKDHRVLLRFETGETGMSGYGI